MSNNDANGSKINFFYISINWDSYEKLGFLKKGEK
jgi:hypothetical protein